MSPRRKIDAEQPEIYTPGPETPTAVGTADPRRPFGGARRGRDRGQ